MSITAIKKNLQGFTLIELLIVIAVLGVLAAGVLVAINPGEQLARGRDASRKTAVGQLNKAIQAYYTSQGKYLLIPTSTNNWMSVGLVGAGEIKSAPGVVTFSTSVTNTCTGVDTLTSAENGFCYGINAAAAPAEAAVWTRMESGSENAKCAGVAAGTNFGTLAYFLWSSKDGKAGVACMAGEPSAANIGAGGFTYK